MTDLLNGTYPAGIMSTSRPLILRSSGSPPPAHQHAVPVEQDLARWEEYLAGLVDNPAAELDCRAPRARPSPTC